MPLHHSSSVDVKPKIAQGPKPQKMELDKAMLVQIAKDLKERDDQLDELKFLNDEMRRGYEGQIAILKDLADKSALNPDIEKIKSMIDRKEKELTKIMTIQDGKEDNIAEAKDEEPPKLLRQERKKNLIRPTTASKKPGAKIWK